MHIYYFLYIFVPLTSTCLSCGVMVTQQILVLSFWVRIPAAQRKKERSFETSPFISGGFATNHRLFERSARTESCDSQSGCGVIVFSGLCFGAGFSVGAVESDVCPQRVERSIRSPNSSIVARSSAEDSGQLMSFGFFYG